MSKVNTYLNFNRKTEEAFNFYKSVFGGEFLDKIQRLADVPAMEGQPPIKEEDKNLILHIALPILGSHILMGTDAPESMGFKLTFGNNMYINLVLDTKEDTDKYFNALSVGGKIGKPLQDMFFGDYYGDLIDKYGVQWMFNCPKKK